MDTLGARLRRARQARRMTTTALGEAVGRRHTAIVRYEAGSSAVDDEMLRRLAAVLDVSVGYLMGESQELPSPTVSAEMQQAGAGMAARREELKLTQADVAAALGVDASLISKWERGERLPKGDLLMKLLRELETTIPLPWAPPEWLTAKPPRRWPLGLKEFIRSARATELGIVPEEVPQLAALARHSGWEGDRVDDVWGLMLLSVRLVTGELGEPGHANTSAATNAPQPAPH